MALAALLASGGVAAPTSGVVAAGAVGVLGLLSHYFSTSNCFYSWWSGGTQ
ncbi:hypothetical protein [Helicobacter suis]|uniref:hypothetical protein n=1 Tax=Helicobacter suis TaxID=104628 RepID=UPI0024918004|nr:hypothetical protein [Helicobacter suis]